LYFANEENFIRCSFWWIFLFSCFGFSCFCHNDCDRRGVNRLKNEY
jgi:hypothetical protein